MTPRELYIALLSLVKQKAAARPVVQSDRKLYYISAEFLIGRLLGNNLINLGLYDEIDAELRAVGLSLPQIEAEEPEPSLGNGGLGRLAACFLDSIATMGLPGDGVGLCYHFGLFRQYFWDRKQLEETNPWIEPNSWLTATPVTFEVPFGRFTLTAQMVDIDVVGYGGGISRLHLFDLETLNEQLVQGGIQFDKRNIPENLTLFLYPDDSDDAGRLLRVYQQYFMVSCAAQLILRELDERGFSPDTLDQHAVIQINDTHPSMVIPELIRLLTARGISFDRAVEIVTDTCAYTNHTILAEALETWPMHAIDEVAPQIVPILRKLDERIKAKYPDPAVALIDGLDRVHMANLDIHYGFSVNGVAALHTEILKTEQLKPFYDIYPQKFSNKTNGVTFRRWLMHCNPRLAQMITSRIGDGWKREEMELEALTAFLEDDAVLEQMLAIKHGNKETLKQTLLSGQGIHLHDEAVFDIQIKRIHEYKRQQMNALYVIDKYLKIKAGHLPVRPITMIFGGKAAPAYQIAKDIIHLILCLSKCIADDPDVSPWLQVVMVENYNVMLAEQLIPACDISEQISLASKEASGTGNMKFMLNGAVTLGTLDGANVEIHELVGDHNIFLFGKTSAEIIELLRSGTYRPAEIVRGDMGIEHAMDFIVGPQLQAIGDPDALQRLYKNLMLYDGFMALLDLRHYIEMKDWALGEYENRRSWAQKMLVNTAMAGYFSSDRTIAQYNEDIWRLSPTVTTP